MNHFRFPLVTLLALLTLLSTVTNVPTADAWSDATISVSTFGSSDYDSSNDLVVDSSGNIYTTGYFNGTVDFDPGAGIAELTSTGGEEAFISKLNASGNFLWAKKFGGTSTISAESIALDSNGNVLITGYFYGTVDFNPGPETLNLTSIEGSDVFIMKLDASGNYLWAKKFGGGGDDNSYGIKSDSTGNVFTTGSFYDSVDFDPGVGNVSLSSSGQNDIFISKLSSSGDFLWAKVFGGPSFDEGKSIAVDGNGDVVATGYFMQTVDFNPGSGISNLTARGSLDIFLSKLDFSGNFLWAKSIGGNSSDSGKSIAIDGDNNILAIGSFSGTADFDPGSAESILTSAGNDDIFISKYDLSGNFVWANRFGASGSEFGNRISIDGNGDVYTTGSFAGTVDFDPGSGTVNLVSAGSEDVFISKLDSSGDYLWAKRFGGAYEDFATSLALDSSGNILTTGYFAGTVDFDPGTNTIEITSGGEDDVFILRLNPSGEAESSLASSLSSSSSSSPSSSSSITTDPAAAAAAIREAAKKAARAELVVGFKDAKPATVQKFAEAGISGVNEFNIEAVNSEIALLPESVRVELASILKVARKFEVVGVIASNQVKQVSPALFVEIGLISADSKYKTSLVNAVRRLDSKDRNSYEAISRALVAESAIIKKRAERMAKIYSRSSERNQG